MTKGCPLSLLPFSNVMSTWSVWGCIKLFSFFFKKVVKSNQNFPL